MSGIDDGGQAFPGEQGHTPDGTWNQSWEYGMSLRDYFAGQALAGILAHRGCFRAPQEAARASYEYADSMIKRRKHQ